MEPVGVCCMDTYGIMQGIVLGVVIRESDGLKGNFSSRTVVYGGPLISESHKRKTHIAELLIEALLAAVAEKSVFTQVRGGYDMSAFDEVFAKFKFKWYPRLNLLIDTRLKAEVQRQLSSSRKRQIRTSLANKAKIVQPESEEQIKAFYSILYNLYKQKVKKPLPDYSFFQAFFSAIVQNESKDFSAGYFLIEYEKEVIGGILCPYLRNGTVFEWYVCGLDQEYREKGIYPSVLATWAAIEFAVNGSSRQFDFMGVGIPGKPYGVRDFKMKFGGHQVNYGRYTRINNRWIYMIAEMGYNLLSLFKKI